MCSEITTNRLGEDLPPGTCRQHGPPSEFRDPGCELGEPVQVEEIPAELYPEAQEAEPHLPDLRALTLAWIAKQREGRQDKPHGNYASELGHPCERYIYLSRTAADRSPISEELAAIFQFGSDFEVLASDWYRRLGFRLEKQETRFEVTDPETGEVLWTGRTDGVLVDPVTGARYAVETKALRDARNIPGHLLPKYLAQVQLYLGPDALDLSAGFLMPWDKGDGTPYPVPVRRDDEERERLHDKARRLNRAVEAGEPPDHTRDLDLCQRCPFKGLSCHPAVEIAPVNIVDHPEVEAMLREAVDLEEAGKRHAGLSRQIKEAFKGNADGTYLTTDGITVTVNTNKGGATTVKWFRQNDEGDDQ